MTEESDAPRWLPPLSLVGIVVSIALISFTPAAISPYPLSPLKVTGQALLLIIIIRAFCYWPPMVRWVRSMPIPHRAIFALAIGAMIVGHYTFNSGSNFPYVAWEIFPSVHEDDPVTCRQFIATTASGKQVRLIAEQLFPSIVQIYPLDSAERFPEERLEQLARAMAVSYSARHSADPVQRVDLVVMSVQLHPPAGESRAQPSCQLLKRYEISSGQ